jgi:large subunit ribosomal protein L21
VRKELDFDFDEVKKLPTVPGWVARCELTVLEHTRSPMEVMLKKKRRKGYQRTIRSKQGWTRLRVGDIILGEGESTIAAATMEETTA